MSRLDLLPIAFPVDDTREVPLLDPLGLDGFYSKPLCEYSPQAIATTLKIAAKRGIQASRVGEWARGFIMDLPPKNPSIAEALAILRDIDPLLRAQAKHQLDIWKSIPGLEDLLLQCGNVAGHIPCGGNDTYGRFNPPYPRVRNFTGTEEERALFFGLAQGESQLDDLLWELTKCCAYRIGLDGNAVAANQLVEHWEPMIESAKLMRKAQVAPVMSTQIAPWVSNVLTIDGKEYRGPTAAQLPVVLVDGLLWGADVDDAEYREYYAFYASEQPLYRRWLMEHILEVTDGRSLLSRIEEDLPKVIHPVARENARRSLEGLAALLQRIYGFRISHRNFAIPSLSTRTTVREDREEAWGSGSFDPSMILKLIDYTEQAQERVTVMQKQLGG